jgi:hypothetical protein
VISPREFCREPGYASTLLLTYTFDPMYFERLVFSDLSYGGSDKIVVIADAGEIQKAMDRCAGQVRQLGRRYLLVPARAGYSFHPKLIARFGRQGGAVWIGSGNLTAGGWGGNQELGASWKIGPEEDDRGIWLTDLLSQALEWTGEEFQKRELQNLIDHSWLDRGSYKNRTAEAPVLLGSYAQCLSDDLASRWSGRRFTDLRLMTGSTDEDGRFLRWAHETFGVENITIYMTPANASFDPRKLDQLPMNISFLPAPSDAMIHAKFYWFSGEGGDAAVIGSANASRSAWQLIDGKQGNVELIVPYDHPSAVEFGNILSKFERDDLRSPSDVLNQSQPEKVPDDSNQPYRLAALEVSYGASSVSARIEPVPEEGAEVSLVFRPGSVWSDLQRDGDIWRGQLPESAPGLGAAMFASAKITLDGAKEITPIRWADCIEEIRQSSRARSAGSVISDLGDRGSTNKEQTQVLKAIQNAADFIMEAEGNEFDDTAPSIRQGGREPNQAQGGEEARIVDPKSLLRSISETGHRGSAQGNLSPAQIGQLSFGGIMRSLFAFQSQEVSNDETQVKAEPETVDQAAEQPENVYQSNRPGDRNPNISDQMRAKLGLQLDEFVEQLASTKFAEKCSPRQLLEATAFPVAVSLNAAQGGWFGKNHVGKIAMQVCSILFDKRYGRGLPVGLLNYVRSRSVSDGNVENFDDVFGDGRLWCVLIAAACISDSTGVNASIQKAEILSQVFTNETLLCGAEEADIRLFLTHLCLPGAGTTVAKMAPRAVEAMDLAKTYMEVNWDGLYLEQGNGRRLHRNGAILWSPDWGWRLIEGGVTYASGYINLGWTSQNHSDFSVLIDQLVASVESPVVEEQPHFDT